MSDDFNTPVVIAIIFDIFRFVNANRDKLLSEKASKIEYYWRRFLMYWDSKR